MFDFNKRRHRLRIIIPAYPAFNVYSNIAKRTTALGPVCIASVVNEMEGWDVEVIDENNLRRYGPKSDVSGADHEFLQQQRPADIVGFYGGLTSTIPRLYELARFYKEKGVVTIAGGQHFVEQNIAEALNSNLDYLIIGEGEETIKELLKTLEQGKDISTVRGIAYLEKNQIISTKPRDPITDFDKLPIPNFSLVRYAKIKLYPVGRIRGCGMDCEFCTVRGIPRCASAERLLENIRFLVETCDSRHFFIVDDLFGQYRDETIRFCRMLRDYQQEIGQRLDLAVQIRLDKARDPELLEAMRQAGISTVAIGFESPIEEELRAMKKKVKPQDMINLARAYHEFGFLVHGMFIYGYPLKEGEKISLSAEERIKKFRKFIKMSKIDTIQVLLPVPIPGTELHQRLSEQNRIFSKEDIGWEYYDGNFPIFKPDHPLTTEMLQESIYKIMGKFYRFRYMFEIAFHTFSFPALVFYLHNIKKGWRRWYRVWRNNLLRFGGWAIMKKWMSMFKKSAFQQKLKEAEEHLVSKN